MSKAKRKPYSPARHLNTLVKGCTIANDANDEYAELRDRYGTPVTPSVAHALTNYPWRWCISITVYASAGDLERVSPVEFTTESAHRLNDLTDIVQEYRLQAVTELPSAFTVDRVHWVARVV